MAAAAASATAFTGLVGGLEVGGMTSSLVRRVASATETGLRLVSTSGSSGLTARGLRLEGGVGGV